MQKLLNIQEIADLLGVSIYTIRRYVRKGEISAVRVTTRLMFSAEEVARIQSSGIKSIPNPPLKKKATEAAAPATMRKVRAARH